MLFRSAEVRHIRIIVNDADIRVARSIDREWWGCLRNRVIIQHRSKLFPIPSRFTRGWITQQLCKLIGAAESKSDWVMILDAKTWFIRAVSEKLFFQDGRAIIRIMPPNNRFDTGRQVLEQEHQVDLAHAIGPLGVPYWFNSNIVRDLIAQHDDFFDYFTTVADHPTFVTEFLLYYCQVVKSGLLDELYLDQHRWAPWHVGEGDEGTFDRAFARLQSPRHNYYIITSSIHRNCFGKLSDDQLQKWVTFLHQREVIPDPQELLDLIAHYRETPLVRAVQIGRAHV